MIAPRVSAVAARAGTPTLRPFPDPVPPRYRNRLDVIMTTDPAAGRNDGPQQPTAEPITDFVAQPPTSLPRA